MTVSEADDADLGGPSRLLFDITGIDLTATLRTREYIETWNPHRGDMSMLDAVVWEAPDRSRGIAVKHVRADEFWVPGHFPGKPMLPGVLMIESAAQLACYLYISRKGVQSLVAFLRLENAAFRSSVSPGQSLYLLCQDVKVGRRKFVCDVQGVQDGKVAFDARLSGMMIKPVENA